MSRSARMSLRPGDWPAPDRAMWSALTTPCSPLDDDGALARLRPASLATLATAYGRWLGWLARTEPAALQEPPALRLTPARLSAWLAGADLAGLAPVSRLTLVEQTLRVLSAFAPERDWSVQRRQLRPLRHAVAETPTTRKQGRILSSVDLFRAGLALMHAGRGPGSPTDGPAGHATGDPVDPTDPINLRWQRDGLMIAVLALLPMRRRAFCALELGRSVLVTPSTIRIHLPAALMKSGQPWECALPAPLEPPLRHYLAEIRPRLMADAPAPHAFLWVTDRGARYGDVQFGQHIGDVTGHRLGVRVSPHLFRDAAATTLARISPDAARLTRALLGHATHRTAERHYNHARMIEAGREYAQLVTQASQLDATEPRNREV